MTHRELLWCQNSGANVRHVAFNEQPWPLQQCNSSTREQVGSTHCGPVIDWSHDIMCFHKKKDTKLVLIFSFTTVTVSVVFTFVWFQYRTKLLFDYLEFCCSMSCNIALQNFYYSINFDRDFTQPCSNPKYHKSMIQHSKALWELCTYASVDWDNIAVYTFHPAPIHYLNIYWIYVKWTLKKRLQWNLNQYIKACFKKMPLYWMIHANEAHLHYCQIRPPLSLNGGFATQSQ